MTCNSFKDKNKNITNYVLTLIILIFTTLLVLSLSAKTAMANHCNTLGGWHFYCMEKQEEEQKHPKSKEQNSRNQKQTETINKSDEYYINKIKEINQTLEVKKTRAILNPTESNVKDYLHYQKYVLNLSSTFADSWQRVLWKDPNLDYTIKRPVSKIGKETYLDMKKLEKDKLFKELSKRYGIFFVFRSDCPYCHKFAPIVKMLEVKGFNIIPISIDGGLLPEFPQNQTKTNSGQLSKLGIKLEAVPAILLYDGKTNEVITLGFGFLALDEVEERIYMLTSKKVGEDY